jgi:hypothetical protein
VLYGFSSRRFCDDGGLIAARAMTALHIPAVAVHPDPLTKIPASEPIHGALS